MLAFVWSPVRFFEARLAKPPNWLLALTPPVLAGCLDASALVLLGNKMQPVLEVFGGGSAEAATAFQTIRFAAVFSFLGTPATFVLAATLLVSVDVLLIDSRRQLRAAELAGLAFWPSVAGSALIVVAVVVWTPAVPAVPGAASPSALSDAAAEYVRSMRSESWMASALLIANLATLWCAGLLGVVGRVVCRLSVPASIVAALAILVSITALRTGDWSW